MAYLFLCYDRVWYIDAAWQLFLERDSLDETLAKTLIDRVRDHRIDTLVIVTGPWWFTNLRVGTLVCNLLLQYLPEVSCLVMSKIDLYTYLVDQWFLPPYGVLYIGQKKSVRHYDFDQKLHTVHLKGADIIGPSYFVDPIDEYFPEGYAQNHVSFTQESSTIMASYGWQKISLTPLIQSLSSVKVVLPSYYVQPIIG